MRLLLQLILFTLFFTFNGLAQQPAYFLFGQNQFEGIDIYNIIQDFDHNYWFATDQGIYKHDGYRFEKIECDQMKANSVFNFAINSKGVIYCSNLSQQVFQIKNGKCRLVFTIPDKGMDVRILINGKDEVYISTIKKVYVLNDVNQLIHAPKLTDGNSLGPPQLLTDGSIIQHWSNSTKAFIYKSGSFKTVTFSQGKNSSDADDLLHFFKLGSKTYAVDNLKKDIYTFDLNQLITKRIDVKLADEQVLTRFYSIDNTLWVSDNISGVSILNSKLERIHSSDKLFGEYFISYIYKDHEGNMLLSTFDDGVIVIPDMQTSDVLPEFAKYKITRLVKGTDSELYLGTRNGGILKYDGKIHLISEASNKGVESIFYWPKYKIVLEDTKSMNVHFDRNKSCSLNYGSLKDLVITESNEIFMALNAGVYSATYNPITKTFHLNNQLLPDRSYSIEKEKNNLYVSTASGLKFSRNSKTFISLKYQGAVIQALDLEENNGSVYVASSKQGILVFKNGKLIKQLRPSYDDTELTIFKFIIHGKQIFANTQFGLLILNLKGKTINCLNKSTGLTANRIIDFALFKNQLWITHSRGIQCFDLSDITTKVEKPIILLREIRINKKKQSNHSNQGFFTSKQRNLTFVFQVPTLKNRENIRYYYKLEGSNKEWTINNYENNEVTYNALSPGSYCFIVKAENNGVYSQPIIYSFTISVPYYQRWWFICLLILTGLFIVRLTYLRQLNIHKKKAQQINELNASRLTAIQSQMNPHFIFNSLNSIQDLVLKGDIDNSYTFIAKFSNLVRRTLSYSDKDFIDFEQELKLIELYLSLEKLRFKDDLEYTIETNHIEDIKIPPMLIQPFIENALLHGLLHKEGIKRLNITFTLGEFLICEISDNGIGRKKAQEIKRRQESDHESFAVNAIKRRFSILKDHFEGELGFEITDLITNEQVVGTNVVLRIPVQREY